MIKENINYVEQVIDKACMESGRNRRDVTLIAVSKTKPVEMLQEAYETGCRDFGENKVQELVDKYEVMPKDIRWHMIGHLQRNKVKYIIDKVYLIHSVDSLRLAEEISKEAIKKAVDVNILIEVNVAGEESKFGTNMEEAKKLVRDVAKLPNVYIKGLMTIAPFVEKAEENRQFFQQLKKLSVDIAAENIDNVSMEVLSMGMTGDYSVAVSEGATLVRVGTGIFGERNYSVSI
ncbi:MAG: YggS family pyridoxal phosphate-dependent enzyme [Lachnospiraceae bacterium]|nr:YggS family pyridoxal phosphate-dependent enzyme [Lachnospiraceae bacterium]